MPARRVRAPAPPSLRDVQRLHGARLGCDRLDLPRAVRDGGQARLLADALVVLVPRLAERVLDVARVERLLQDEVALAELAARRVLGLGEQLLQRLDRQGD